MNHAKILTGLALAGMLISGCANSGATVEKSSASLETYQSALSAAKAAIKSAKNADYEWRDSGKLLKKAAKAAKAGDFETAIKLTQKAERQGKLALIQSKDQANAGPQ